MNDLEPTKSEPFSLEEKEQMIKAKVVSQPKKKKKKILIIGAIIAVILIIFSTSVWYVFRTSEPKTISELLDRKFKPGETIDIEGTITKIEKYNTSYAPLTLLTLDNNNSSGIYKFLGDNEKHYEIGDKFQTTLHFEEYQFNGNKIITAKELYSTILLSPASIGIVVDAISFKAGFELLLTSIDGNGTIQYEVFTPNGDVFPLNMFNVSLRKGKSSQSDKRYDHKNVQELFAIEYVYLSGGYLDNKEVDFMESLEDNVSRNGSIQFIDKNKNGLLDDYDIFKVYISSTDNEYNIESYFLNIGGSMSGYLNIASGCKYIINWYKGAYGWLDLQRLALSYVSTEENGTLMDTTIRVSRICIDNDISFNQYNFSFEGIGNVYHVHSENDVSEGIVNIGGNISIEYIDKNKNMLLDADDIFIIRGLKNQTHATFEVFDKKARTRIMEPQWIVSYGNLQWIVGYGHLAGRIPYIKLEKKGLVPESENKYQIDVFVPYWHSVLALNSTIRLSLTKDSEPILSDISIFNGIIGSYNGKNITFYDMDNDSYLSTNDYFIMECEVNSTYDLEISLLFDIDIYKSSVQITC